MWLQIFQTYRRLLKLGWGNHDMTEIKDQIEAEATKPRPVFLVAAGVCIALALGAYVYEDSMVGPDGEGALTFAFLLIFLIFAAMGLVLCFRDPRLGNRLLGYDVILKKPSKGVKSDVQYSAGFMAETGADTKQRNTKRKQHRASRRKLAQVTREMQNQQAAKDNAENSAPKP
jgi:hypothetical protein